MRNTLLNIQRGKFHLQCFVVLDPPTFFLSILLPRNVCLCSRHQNLAPKLKALKSMKVIGITNPDTFIKTNDYHQIKAILTAIPHNNVKYEVWKKVEVPNDKGGKSNDDAVKTKM